jgi:hypothetical protein
MKRFLPVLLLVFLLLCACNEQKDFLAYQQKNPTLECVVNEKFELVISKSDIITIKVKKPSEISALYFEFGQGDGYAINGDLKIPLGRESACGLYALSNVLSLENESILSVVDQGKNSIVTFENDLGTYTITYGKNLLPSHIEIHSEKFDYDIVVNGISLE